MDKLSKYIVHSVAGAKRVVLKDTVSGYSLKDAVNTVKILHKGAWNLKITRVEKLTDNYLYKKTDKRYKPKNKCIITLKYKE